MTMRLSHALAQGPFRTASSSSSAPFSRHNFNLSPNVKRVFEFGNHSFRFLNCRGSTSGSAAVSSAANSSSSVIASNSGISRKKPGKLEVIEEDIEKVIYRCWFLAILGAFGSLIGSFLCFIKAHLLQRLLWYTSLIEVK